MRELIVDLPRACKDLGPETEAQPTCSGEVTVRKTTGPHKIASNRYVASDYLKRLGLYFSLLEVSPDVVNPPNSDYSLSFHLRLPLGACALVGQVSWRKHCLSRSYSITGHSSIALGRIVSSDSPGVLACLAGDLADLKEHLASGAATLGDVTTTPVNWSLMTVRYC